MNRLLLKKCLGEARLLWLASAAVMYSFCWVRVWLVSLLDMSRFQNVIEQFREYERFSPVPFEQLFTYTGRVAMTYDEPVTVLVVVIWAIARGTDCVSGELGRGTMEMLLAQPLSRLQVLGTQAGVTITGIVLLCVVSWLGVYTGVHTTTVEEEGPNKRFFIPWLNIEIPNPLASQEPVVSPMSDKTDANYFIPAAVNLFALGFFLAGLSSLMSSWDQYRWRTIGIVIGIYIIQLIMKVVALAADDLAWMSAITFFTAYEPEAIVNVAVNSTADAWSIFAIREEGKFSVLGPFGYDLALIALGCFSYLGAGIIFCRRDLPAPL